MGIVVVAVAVAAVAAAVAVAAAAAAVVAAVVVAAAAVCRSPHQPPYTQERSNPLTSNAQNVGVAFPLIYKPFPRVRKGGMKILYVFAHTVFYRNNHEDSTSTCFTRSEPQTSTGRNPMG